MEDEHGGKVLVSETNFGRLYVYSEEWSGTQFLHIRYWIFDKKQGQWIPARKGIAIPLSKAQLVLQAMLDVLQAA